AETSRRSRLVGEAVEWREKDRAELAGYSRLHSPDHQFEDHARTASPGRCGGDGRFMACPAECDHCAGDRSALECAAEHVACGWTWSCPYNGRAPGLSGDRT